MKSNDNFNRHNLSRELSLEGSPSPTGATEEKKFSFADIKKRGRNFEAGQTMHSYAKQNGKPFRPQSGVRNHHNKSIKMNKKLMESYCNEYMDTRT